MAEKFVIFDSETQTGMPAVLEGAVGVKVRYAGVAGCRLLIWLENGHMLLFRRGTAVGIGALEVLEGTIRPGAPPPAEQLAAVHGVPIAELVGSPFTSQQKNLLFFGLWCVAMQHDGMELGKMREEPDAV